MELIKITWLFYKISKELFSLAKFGKNRLQNHFQVFYFFKRHNWISPRTEDFNYVYFNTIYKLIEAGKPSGIIELFCTNEVNKKFREFWFHNSSIQEIEKELKHPWHVDRRIKRIKNQGLIGLNIEKEIKDFINVFKLVVSENRRISDVENFQLNTKIKKNTERILDHQIELRSSKQLNKFLTKLPVLHDRIIGRNKELISIYQKLKEEHNTLQLHGIGGIGKTTIAIAFISKYIKEYEHIIWIEQISDFSTDINNESTLLMNLGENRSDNPVENTKNILNKISNIKENSLLIIDNANNQLEKFNDYLPKGANWHIIITSREILSFTNLYSIDFLPEEFALKLFYRHYKRDNDDNSLKHILKRIDNHTLTIEILAKIAQKRHLYPLKTLMETLKEKGVRIDKTANFKVLHSKSDKVKRIFPYLKAIFELDGSISGNEKEVLTQFVGLPSKFISINDMRNIGIINENNFEELTVVFDDLSEKGWITHVNIDNSDSYKMHRIIQEVLFDHLQVSLSNLTSLIKSITSKLDFDQLRDNPVDKFTYIIYGERLYSLFPIIKNFPIAKLQSILAALFQEIGRYEEAITIYKNLIHSFGDTLKEKKVFKADIQSNLGLVYKDLGKYNVAASLFENALITQKEEQNPDMNRQMRIKSNLGITYNSLGQFKDAVCLLEESLSYYLSVGGQDSIEVAIQKSNLGMAYKDLGDLEKASKLISSALESFEIQFGFNHPGTATLYSNLGLTYLDQGQFQRSVSLFEKALQINQTIFEKNHPNIARDQTNLAAAFENLGQYKMASKLLEMSLESDKANFGKRSPSTAINQGNLALVYQQLEQYEDAKKMMIESIEILQENYGKEHYRVTGNQSNLALIYKDLKTYDKAIELLEKTLEVNLKTYGEEHCDIARDYNHMGVVYSALNNYDKALELFEKALKLDIKIFGVNHYRVAIRKANIARIYKKTNRKKEAYELYTTIYESICKSFGEKHKYSKNIKKEIDSYQS